MFSRSTYCDPPVYGFRDYIRVLWAGRRWRHWGPFENRYLKECKCLSCTRYYELRLGSIYVSVVGGNGGVGGSSGGGGGNSSTGGYYRCQPCKGPLDAKSGLCNSCGITAAIEWVHHTGVVGGNTGGAGSSYTVGGAGGNSSVSFASGGVVARGGGGWGFSNLCANCGTPIPSGTCCSIRCLRNWDPNLVIYQTGCMDCGSGLHPSYAPGCPKAGRATQWLPIPGPYGSAGLTAAGAVAGGASSASVPMAKVPVRSTGMGGYSEDGTPDDWDLAMGTIRGYRWFKVDIPESWAGLRHRQVQAGYYDATGKPAVTDEGMRDLTDSELPFLFGAYGGKWEDGTNEAACRRSMSTRPGSRAFKHEPPEVREACGCGFWAYFDENLPVDTVLSGWSSPSMGAGQGWTGLAILGCVEGSGRVIVGEKGFRSQYAKIAALAIGQVSVPQLMWWAEAGANTGRNSYTASPNRNTASFNDFLRIGSTRDGKIQCSDEEVCRRLTKVEDMLARKYPGARIVSSENTLRNLFPPDKNNGGS